MKAHQRKCNHLEMVVHDHHIMYIDLRISVNLLGDKSENTFTRIPAIPSQTHFHEED